MFFMVLKVLFSLILSGAVADRSQAVDSPQNFAAAQVEPTRLRLFAGRRAQRCEPQYAASSNGNACRFNRQREQELPKFEFPDEEPEKGTEPEVKVEVKADDEVAAEDSLDNHFSVVGILLTAIAVGAGVYGGYNASKHDTIDGEETVEDQDLADDEVEVPIKAPK